MHNQRRGFPRQIKTNDMKTINNVDDLSESAINKLYSFRNWADKMTEKCPEDGKELQCGTNLHWLFSQISASIECILQDL